MTTLRKLLLASPLLLLGGCTSLEDGYSIKDRRVDGPQQGARLIESAANEAMTAQTNGAHRAAPRLVKTVAPTMPRQAIDQDITGRVEAQLQVDVNGKVTSVKIIR